MPKVILTVVATVDPAHEEEFNRWYNEEHAPQMLASHDGCVSAARYRNLDPGSDDQYIAVYEFVDEDSFKAFQDSPAKPRLVAEYDATQGAFSSRRATGYVQVWSDSGASG